MRKRGVNLGKTENTCRLTKPGQMPQDIFDIAYKCWATEAAERPSFAQLLHLFNTISAESGLKTAKMSEKSSKSLDSTKLEQTLKLL